MGITASQLANFIKTDGEPVVVFNILILQTQHNLSDARKEFRSGIA